MSGKTKEIEFFTPKTLTFNTKDDQSEGKSDCPVHEILKDRLTFTNNDPEKRELRFVINCFQKGKNYWIGCDQSDFLLKYGESNDIEIYAFLRNSSAEVTIEIPVNIFPIEEKQTKYEECVQDHFSIILLPALSEYLEFDECKLGVQIYEGLLNAIYKGTYRSIDVAISKVKSRDERIKRLEKSKQTAIDEGRPNAFSAAQEEELKDLIEKRDAGHVEDFSQSEFVKEIRGIAKLQRNLISPYILTFVGLTEYPFSAITELAPFGDAESLYEKHLLSNTLKYKIFEDIAKGVAACHQVDIMHLDLKPANIFIFSLNPLDSVVAKLADFGAAQRVNFQNPPPGLNLVSTQLYTPPEIYKIQSLMNYPKKWKGFLDECGIMDQDEYLFDDKAKYASPAEKSRIKSEKTRKFELLLYKVLHIGFSIDVFCYALTIFEILIERSLIYTEEFNKVPKTRNSLDKIKKILTEEKDQNIIALRGFPITLEEKKVPLWFKEIIDQCWCIDPSNRLTMSEVAAKFNQRTSSYLDQFKTRNEGILYCLNKIKELDDKYQSSRANFSQSFTASTDLKSKDVETYTTTLKYYEEKLEKIKNAEYENPEKLFDVTDDYPDLVELAHKYNVSVHGLYKKRLPEAVNEFKKNNLRIRFNCEIMWGMKEDQVFDAKETEKYKNWIEDFKRERREKESSGDAKSFSIKSATRKTAVVMGKHKTGVEDVEEEQPAPVAKAGKKKVVKKAVVEEEGDAPAPVAKAGKKKVVKKTVLEEQPEESPAPVAKAGKKKIVKKTVLEEEPEAEPAPVAKAGKKKIIKKTVVEEEPEPEPAPVAKAGKKKIIKKTIVEEEPEPQPEPVAKAGKKKIIKKTIVEEEPEPEPEPVAKAGKKKIIKKTIVEEDPEPEPQPEPVAKSSKKKVIKKTINV